MKRIILFAVLVPCFGISMTQDGRGPFATQQVSPKAEKKEEVAPAVKPAAAPASNPAEAKKGTFARVFACCCGKSEKK